MRAHKKHYEVASHYLQCFCLETDPQDLLRDEVVIRAGSQGRGLSWSLEMGSSSPTLSPAKFLLLQRYLCGRRHQAACVQGDLCYCDTM